MSVDFASPSYRAASSDLTIAISPLGLVELADEEFEVHGPRLARYASNFAWYLGHHQAYRREAGEPTFVFNWCYAFADYLTGFMLDQGVEIQVADAISPIAAPLYNRIWNTDNNMLAVLWELGTLQTVAGDAFCKVTYEDPWVAPNGDVHAGRVRILPLNPSFCFPQYAPHDFSRLDRFKLKYRFWGTNLDGSRQVFTYVEVIDRYKIQEYVNDELIREVPNTLGEIPIVHIRNRAVPSSPWGLSDIQEIIPLNREYNEKAYEISDIINYSTAPVTVITGAKASNLEKGPRKVWSGLPAGAKVENLEGHADIPGALAWLETIKRSMHELTNVPEGALGQMQPASNTSGVALQMLFLPLIRRDRRKKIQMSQGLESINSLAMKILSIKEPQALLYDPSSGMPIDEEKQYLVLNPADPAIYKTHIKWPSPLPIDRTIKIEEIIKLMELGLESKRGALIELGEEQPDAKLLEIFDELRQDAIRDAALAFVRNTVTAVSIGATGVGAEGEAVQTEQPSSEPGAPAPSVPPAQAIGASLGIDQAMLQKILQLAFGPDQVQRTTDNTMDT